MRKLIIYGAQGIALGTYRAVRKLHPEIKVECFLVTSGENNPKDIEGVPVYELESFSKKMSKEEKAEITVLISTPENVMEVIETQLEEKGFSDSVRMNSERWAKCAEQYWIARQEIITPLCTYPIGAKTVNAKVFMTKFWKDVPLMNKQEVPPYMVPVQAGAALTDVRVTEYLDSTGDNISEKNVNYSELTVLYWAWKNKILPEKDIYYGLAHYRRMLMLSSDDFARIKRNEIDVVLPFPLTYAPNIEVHHERYLKTEEWEAVKQALRELQPEYFSIMKDVFGKEYMYNYNIILARGSIISEYCKWLFPILERVEQIIDPQGNRIPNRYIGYIAENLETLYFMYNKQGYRIAHTGCRFLI